MRIRDIIESVDLSSVDDMLEDEADTRGDSNLISILDFLRNRAHDTHVQPKIRADSLIKLVQTSGEQQFGLENLLDSFKNNQNVKGLIKGIKDNSEGVKYVYLVPFADDDFGDEESGDDEAVKTAPEKTVDAMAKSALSKRT